MVLMGCPSDPHSATRDQAEAKAKEIAEDLDLPVGYEVADIEASRAQTPRENRGGGQNGQVSVVFRSTDRLEPSDVLMDLDLWFTGRGMVRADYRGTGSNACTESRARVGWADSEKVIVMHYYSTGRPDYLIVPYGYSGMITGATSAVEGTPPRCVVVGEFEGGLPVERCCCVPNIWSPLAAAR